MRTPNYCLPMNQRKLDPNEEEKKKANGDYEKAFNDCRKTFAGFLRMTQWVIILSLVVLIFLALTNA